VSAVYDVVALLACMRDDQVWKIGLKTYIFGFLENLTISKVQSLGFYLFLFLYN